MGKRSVSESARYAILHDLLKRSIDGELAYGAQKATAATFGVHRQTVGSIWKLYNASVAAGNVAGDIKCKYKGNSGRKGYNKRKLKQKLEAVPAHQRSTIRAAALSVQVFVGVIQWLLASHDVAARTTTIKPVLTESNKRRRVQYSLSFLDDGPRQHGKRFGWDPHRKTEFDDKIGL
ncbi:hypothetical protein PI124_g15410 [Phytophthora idaei]|nr:hypothetical protein PI125_g15219 [Phytophthora idaei]KAG3136739.1 hypothetical protein PI126_g17684 [Phytophthora idaei]KAG3239668.1 hypothetical protein PI124_g15410 [Phytophthora idaei]